MNHCFAAVPAVLRASIAAGIGCVFGCDSGPEATVAERAQAVLEGEPSDRASVVLVLKQTDSDANQCSGTMIAPNLLLTARHCVSAFTDGDYTCTIDGNLDNSRPRSPANAGDMGLPFPPERIEIHLDQQPTLGTPDAIGKQIIAPETDTICRNDIAFVVLENELDVAVSPVRLTEGVYPGQLTTVVGYGTNELRTTARFERSGLSVLAVGPSEFFEQEGYALPRTFVLGRSVCPGDSGGPALDTETDAALGVFSFFRGTCTDSEARNFFSQLAPYRSHAEQAFEAAGHAPVLEGQADPSGPVAAGGQGQPVSHGGGGVGEPGSSGCAIASGRVFSTSTGAAWLALVGLVGAALLRKFSASAWSAIR